MREGRVFGRRGALASLNPLGNHLTHTRQTREGLAEHGSEQRPATSVCGHVAVSAERIGAANPIGIDQIGAVSRRQAGLQHTLATGRLRDRLARPDDAGETVLAGLAVARRLAIPFGAAVQQVGLRIDATAVAKERTLFGRLLETFVFQELNRQSSWQEQPIRFHHFRDRDGVEVDIVLEQGANAVVGVEVKAGATVTKASFSGLQKLAQAAGRRFVRGVVLHDGEQTLPFGDRLQAVPIRRLWETA